MQWRQKITTKRLRWFFRPNDDFKCNCNRMTSQSVDSFSDLLSPYTHSSHTQTIFDSSSVNQQFCDSFRAMRCDCWSNRMNCEWFLFCSYKGSSNRWHCRMCVFHWSLGRHTFESNYKLQSTYCINKRLLHDFKVCTSASARAIVSVCIEWRQRRTNHE